ncbi:MAG TPA: hypothetical protein PLC89_13275 [Haliscomenobacter sp.]|uniref:hypothetical protein n=1 Tax=Haliscomenobacter sp. TaxID=2717303 RepID=UPI001E12D8E8|nr:hypothetical protein [Haliscomenobacter sp.]MBK9488746.1 hypothetical protein [Haliscomenobacter sp.]HOY18270.1 hypothetical protein [Haliscomenobacter sp.]HPH20686.1 hypothetical protein [Haliscomenobacter sp.]
MAKYTGLELSTVELGEARNYAREYVDANGDFGAVPLMNYAFFSVAALDQLLDFCQNNPNVKGVKFNLALLPKPGQPTGKMMSLVTWAVDEDGAPIDGAATQSSNQPCPPLCIPPQ